MKRTYILLLSLLLLAALLSGCECDHQWVAADCVTPKTCEKCQIAEGEAWGHTWQDASCESAKTCGVCGATEGDPLGHEWQEATCMVPMTCSVCGQTEGELGGHSFDQVDWYPVWEDGELIDVEKMSGPCICGTWIETDMDWELVANSLIPGRWIIKGVALTEADFEDGENYLDVFPDGTATIVLLGEPVDLTWSYTYPENLGIWFELVAEDGSKTELSVIIFKKRPESEWFAMLILDNYLLDLRK